VAGAKGGAPLDVRIGGVKPPSVPQNLEPPAGQELVFVLHATGYQIYTCQPGADGKSSWVLKMPEADLRDDAGKLVGKHFTGPTWEHIDGSRIVAKATARAEAPIGGAVPWILLTVTDRCGGGVLGCVTSIQRIHTQGGEAPPSVAQSVQPGEELKVRYSADYYFYAPHN